MKKIFCAVVVIMTLASCGIGDNTLSTQEAVKLTHDKLADESKTYARRVKVLENNTVSFVHFNTNDQQVYTLGDTVWVNLRTHRIDDVCETAMMCVIDNNVK